MPNKNSIRLISDINPEDVLADLLGAIRVDEFQVIVTRAEDGSIRITVSSDEVPIHLRSMVIDGNDAVVMVFLREE